MPADGVRWIVAPPTDAADVAAPLLARLATFRGGWPNRERDDWRGFNCEKFGPQAFVFSRPLDDRRLYLKWLPRIFLTKRRRGLAVWPSPARQHARWTERVRALGLPVVDLLGAGDLRRSTLDPRQAPSFILTASPVGSRTLRDALLDDDLTDEQRRRMADLVADAAARLHDARIRRVDLRPANLLIEPAADRVLFFDFDSFRYDRARAARTLARHRAKDMLKVERTRRILLRQAPVPAKWKAQRDRNASVSQT